MKSDSYKILGTEVNPMDTVEILEVVATSVKNKERTIICSQNLHSIYLFHHDSKIKELQDMAKKRIDGMVLILILRLYGYKVSRGKRLTWVDLFWPLIEFTNDRQLKLYILGATEDVSKKANGILKQKYPTLKLWMRNGYFKLNGDESADIIKDINEVQPDILIVGMGMPRQEHWILKNYSNLDCHVVFTAGAILEYITGYVSTPPRFIGNIGLEWMYRLIENPRRFWKRYLIEPWTVFHILIKDLYRIKILRKGAEG